MSKKIAFLFLVACSTTFYLSGNNSLYTGISEQAVVEKTGNHEDAADYVWDASKVIPITLNGNSISISTTGATVKGSTITITSAGTYSLSGSLTNGQIIVNSKDKETVRLILNGVNINCSNSAPIYIIDSKKTVIVLAENTKNQISDGSTYITVENEPNAAIFSKSNLSFFGKGSLTVTANFKDGIGGKDGIIIKSGTISVTSADDGIRGKNYLIIRDGNIVANSKGDGLSSDNEVDPGRGYVLVNAGTINLTSGGDGIQAVTDVKILGGSFNIKTGTAKSTAVAGTVSNKGIKAADSLIIKKGTFVINTTDDAVHSSSRLRIDNGTFTLTTGDDGIHADTSMVINGGTINIVQSYEGIESQSVTINGGNIHLLSSDDGLNAATGRGSAGGQFQGGPGGGGFGGRGGRGGGGFGGGGNNMLYINGGYTSLKASGDGMDINGSVVMTGGTLVVDGPIENMNGPLDYDGTFKITGGTVYAAGSAGMAMIPGSPSTQCSVLVIFNSMLAPGTLVHLRTAAGKELFTFTNSKYFQSVAFSSPELKIGTTYEVYVAGKSTGTLTDGVYKGGVYTPGTKSTSFTLSTISQRVNY